MSSTRNGMVTMYENFLGDLYAQDMNGSAPWKPEAKTDLPASSSEDSSLEDSSVQDTRGEKKGKKVITAKCGLQDIVVCLSMFLLGLGAVIGFAVLCCEKEEGQQATKNDDMAVPGGMGGMNAAHNASPRPPVAQITMVGDEASVMRRVYNVCKENRYAGVQEDKLPNSKGFKVMYYKWGPFRSLAINP